ncbi:hypothetical protein Lal_00033685, partial [Lupinus albus]
MEGALNAEVHNGRGNFSKRGVLELDTHDAILAQHKLLTQQLEALTKQMANLPQQLNVTSKSPSSQPAMWCDTYFGDHLAHYCLPHQLKENLREKREICDFESNDSWESSRSLRR